MGTLFGSASPIGPVLPFGINPAIFALLLIWAIVWKGLALWKSAREESKVWFIVLLVVNTFGILEILYIYVFSKKHGIGEGHDGDNPTAH